MRVQFGDVRFQYIPYGASAGDVEANNKQRNSEIDALLRRVQTDLDFPIGKYPVTLVKEGIEQTKRYYDFFPIVDSDIFEASDNALLAAIQQSISNRFIDIKQVPAPQKRQEFNGWENIRITV